MKADHPFQIIGNMKSFDQSSDHLLSPPSPPPTETTLFLVFQYFSLLIVNIFLIKINKRTEQRVTKLIRLQNLVYQRSW